MGIKFTDSIQSTLESKRERGGLAIVRGMKKSRPTEPGSASLTGSDELSQDPYRLLVEQVTEYAIFVLDVAGYIQTWKSGAERSKG